MPSSGDEMNDAEFLSQEHIKPDEMTNEQLRKLLLDELPDSSFEVRLQIDGLWYVVGGDSVTYDGYEEGDDGCVTERECMLNVISAQKMTTNWS